MTDEEIENGIQQLSDEDFGKQLIALGRLVGAGEAAVPRLFVALARYPEARTYIVFALAGIASRDSEVIQASISFWEANLTDPLLNQALLSWVKKLAAPIAPQNIAALTCFLGCWRKHSVVVDDSVRHTVGTSLSTIAAQALASLSYSHPTTELLLVLPYMKGSHFLNGVPPQIETARKTIERNTAHMKDLPRIAEAPKISDKLPLPADASKGSEENQ